MGQTSTVGGLVRLSVWAIAGTFGPILLIVGLVTGHGVWLGVAVCCIWVLDLGFDAIIVRRRRTRDPNWNAWAPGARWLRS
jgi:hypothetical protein